MLISEEVKHRLAMLTKIRRDIHMNPELSLEEFKTCDYIFDFLSSLGFKPKKIDTGVYVDILGENKNKSVALRADIDALPIKENTHVEYASKNGNMHACGHDAHTAMLLTFADILKDKKPPCNVRLIFQFGEEGYGGAEKMIGGGVLDNVGEIYALHVDPTLEKGRLATTAGAMFAGCCEFDIIISGEAAHCAEREKGADALKAAQEVYSRLGEATEGYEKNTLLHCGAINAGTARNIVANYAQMNMTLRFFDETDCEHIMTRLSRILVETDNKLKTDSTIKTHGVYPPLINSSITVANIKRLIPEIENCGARYTAEDFSFYLKKVSGCMLWLGTRDNDFAYPLHSDKFGLNEDSLLFGVEFFNKIIYLKQIIYS